MHLGVFLRDYYNSVSSYFPMLARMRTLTVAVGADHVALLNLCLDLLD